ncbi:ATP-binding protein [Kribbella sp. GL6]|uniref:ATP-binding protein n=1 Tax=Kribbella sp. GL6 TaxID=3419765 RepID=UPI003D02960D
MSEFGAVLRTFRRTAGLSQEKLAEASGVSVEAIKTLEAGRRRHPRPQTMALLASGLGLTDAERAELVAAGTKIKASKGIPEQLPDDLQDFAGRDEQVDQVEKLFRAAEIRQGVVVVSAIAGMGGVGKTALGIHVGHRLADQFTDGQLYVNLRGFGPGAPMTAAEALGRLMDALGLQVTGSESVDELAARYRSAVAGRRLFVFLDNAASVPQVLPLLPGTSTCAVLITSRRALIGLPGAAHLALDTLPGNDAVKMLDHIVGDGRIAADPLHSAVVVRLCGGLPLALRIAGARLAAEPSWSVADFARLLKSSRRRLDELALGDLDVRASIEASLAAMTDAEAGTLRLLGLFEGDELDVRVAARLLDRPVAETEDRLERLVDLHLLESPSPRRYRMHDLIRSYVRDTTAELTTEADLSAARGRVLRFYLAMVWRGRVLRGLGPLTTSWSDESWTADAEELSYPELSAWYDLEIEEIIGAAHRAAQGSNAERSVVAKIATGIKPYLTRRRRYSDAVALCHVGLVAEETVQDPIAAVFLHFDLSVYYNSMGRYDEAVEQMRLSLSIPEAWLYEEQWSYSQTFLADYLTNAGRYDEAVAAAQIGMEASLRRGDEEGEVDARAVLGRVAGKQGRWDDQDREFERVLEVMRKDAHPSVRHYNLQQMVVSYREDGRLREALAWATECHRFAVDFGNVFAIAEALEELGRIHLGLGALEPAEECLRSALETVEGNWQAEARVRKYLGDVLQLAGSSRAAGAEWQRALELAVRHGAPEVPELRKLVDGLTAS